MRSRYGTMTIVGLLAAGLPVSACSAGGEDAEASASGAAGARTVGESASQPASEAGLVRVELAVGGMTCGGCALGVRTALNRLDGVTRTEVSYDDARAVVTFDPARVDAATMIGAIGELGYTATVVGGEERS